METGGIGGSPRFLQSLSVRGTSRALDKRKNAIPMSKDTEAATLYLAWTQQGVREWPHFRVDNVQDSSAPQSPLLQGGTPKFQPGGYT